MSMQSDARQLRFAVIGAGMAGILSAIKLTEAGYDDFTIYEKADRLGGTWRENTYPGIACDVPSHLYSYSFALNPEWTYRFSPGNEIYDYFERIAREYDVVRRIRFDEEVLRCEWLDGQWNLTTSLGQVEVFDVVIAATGVLHHPNMPDLDGLDEFHGPWFHSARWDHSVPLEDKRVGVIGTGSSGIQITGALAGNVKHLTVFQRTAQWIMPQENPPYTAEEHTAYREHPEQLAQEFAEQDALFSIFANAVVNADSPEMGEIEKACREYLEAAVRDPELRERLRPSYRAACKRLVVSPNYYEAMQHPDTQLVTEKIQRIEPSGVRTVDDELHELDVLVLATGFRAHDFMKPMEVAGRNGLTLEKAWSDRAKAYLSISIPDFPNLFMLNGPNGPVGNFSLIGVSEMQFAYILQLVERLRNGECASVVATHEALDRFEEQRYEAAQHTIWFTGCRSWYLDDRGIPAVWPFPFERFREEMKKPDFADYECG
jgi:cation diffusion facilitator CzcD-associated flavoprotein CzcO